LTANAAGVASYTVAVVTRPIRLPDAFAACMTVRNGLPSGATDMAPFSTLTPVDMAEAAAAESVTYGP
jgi:hypothetical protein